MSQLAGLKATLIILLNLNNGQADIYPEPTILPLETQCFGEDYVGLMTFFMVLNFRENRCG
ncbi:hypothetical protein BZK42_23810 [Citrobacter braakii]|uniref:Uncharacterized protein n=1 Tax=Citrobacter braakii TaxID=57706 RepID=A0A1V8NT97_CITBR|nr:hypothetical protein BZK42_23810 [Citrobacter braakii]